MKHLLKMIILRDNNFTQFYHLFPPKVSQIKTKKIIEMWDPDMYYYCFLILCMLFQKSCLLYVSCFKITLMVTGWQFWYWYTCPLELNNDLKGQQIMKARFLTDEVGGYLLARRGGLVDSWSNGLELETSVQIHV